MPTTPTFARSSKSPKGFLEKSLANVESVPKLKFYIIEYEIVLTNERFVENCICRKQKEQ
jgi:hypothetical protein